MDFCKKNPLSKGAEPGSVTLTGKGRGAVRLLPQPLSRPHNVDLLSYSETDDSGDSGEENTVGTIQPSRSPLGVNLTTLHLKW